MSTIHDTPRSDLEARLRDEFTDRAANATGADRILTALAKQPIELRPSRTRSVGRWAVAAAAVAVVLAGVPIGLHLAGNGQSPTITAAPEGLTQPKDISYDLAYQPTWLPANFTADSREGTADGTEQQS
ncbi:MAG TPA: hypothetical protein VHZ97_30570, partial [Pseudonocardiaceae bacterium]|nr:hypothetical protein [Pseudonocardiaceae bacterium]